MVQVICCSSFILSNSGGGCFEQGFYHKFVSQCRAFSRALKTEKLKALLFSGPYKLLVHKRSMGLVSYKLVRAIGRPGTKSDLFCSGFRNFHDCI